MTQGIESFTGWVLAAVAAVVSTLAAVVSILWKQNEMKNAQAIAKLEKENAEIRQSVQKCEVAIKECEEDRVKLRIELVRLCRNIGIDQEDEL